MNKAILLVSHGKLAIAIKESVELIIGKQKNLIALPMEAQETLESYENKLEEQTKKLFREGYEEIIILADIKGGTPCNASAVLMLNDERIKLIAGFNLILVIELCVTTLSIEELVNNAAKSIEVIKSPVVG